MATRLSLIENKIDKHIEDDLAEHQATREFRVELLERLRVLPEMRTTINSLWDERNQQRGAIGASKMAIIAIWSLVALVAGTAAALVAGH